MKFNEIEIFLEMGILVLLDGGFEGLYDEFYNKYFESINIPFTDGKDPIDIQIFIKSCDVNTQTIKMRITGWVEVDE